MKNLIFILIVAGAGAYFLRPGTKELAPREFAEALGSSRNKLLIDLRKNSDFSNGHIAGATNIDSGWPTYKRRIAELSTSLHVFLYCADGVRSAQTAAYMRSVGFDSVSVLKGGLAGWAAERFAVTPAELVPPPEMHLKEFSRMMDLEHLVLVDFYLPGDKKCRQLEPALDELAEAYRDRIKILRIDIDAYKYLATELGITAVPTLHFYENGNLTGWIEGAYGRDRIEGEFGLRDYTATKKNKQPA